MLAFRQFCADSPGDIVAVQAAFYRGAAASVTGNKFVGLFGCAFVMVEPGIFHGHHPAKLMSCDAAFSASRWSLNARDNTQRHRTSSAAL